MVRHPIGMCALSLALALMGCGGSGGGASGGGDGLGGGSQAPTYSAPTDLSILLPAGADLDLSTMTVLSQMGEHPVTGTGQSQAMFDPTGRILSVVFDADGRPFLLGFITDDSREVTVASTVEATLFFALDMPRMPEDIQQTFWNEVRMFRGYPDAVEEAEMLLVEDPAFLRGEAYRVLMEGLMMTLTQGAGFRKIESFDSQERSGLRLEELAGDRVRVANVLRRRCHAFIYKVASTDQADEETTYINDLPMENPAPKQDVVCGPVTAYDSLVGSAQNWAAGNGIKFFRTESDPLDASLIPGEKKARFAVRVVGPSATPGVLTDMEEAKLRELEREMLALDVILPILFKLAGQDSFLKNLKSSPDLEALGKLTQKTLKQLPGIATPLAKGQFGAAFRAIVDGVLDGTLSDQLVPIYTEVAEYIGKNMAGLDGDDLELFTKKAGKFNKYLEIMDLVLEVNKYREVFSSVFQADMVEEFEVVSSSGKVTLSPPNGVAVQGEGLKFKVDVQDTQLDGAVFEYTWSTTGAYGELRDGVGHSGPSFVSSQDEVEYFSSPATPLPEGVKATDVVTVRVAIRSGSSTTEVGEKSSSVEVRELGFEILPQDVELEGGDRVTLSVRRTDGQDPFTSPDFDYKVVWDTQGEFGFFDGTSTTVTSTTRNDVLYVCLEKEEQGTEDVSARVYYRAKGSTDPYQLVERVHSSLRILNDPNIEIFYVPRFTYTKSIMPSIQGVARWSVLNAFSIPKVEGAISYTIEIVEWQWIFSWTFVGYGDTWQAGDASMLDDKDSSQFVYFPSGGTQIHEPEFGQAVSTYNAAKGVAKVTVTLAPR